MSKIKFQWNKAGDLARQIRDNEQSGRGEVIVIDQGETFPEEIISALGDDFPAEFPESQKSDLQSQDPTKTLFKISNESGELEVTEIGSGEKLDRSLLDSSDCFLLNCENDVFVWKGSGANVEERRKALDSAIKWSKDNDVDKRITVVPEQGETELFKDAFQDF